MSLESGGSSLSRGTFERVRGLLHPVHESLGGEDFLRKALALMVKVGVTRATSLVIDGNYIYSFDDRKDVDAGAVVGKGLAHIRLGKRRGEHIVLISQSRTAYFHVVLSLRYIRKHPKHDYGIAINVSAIPLRATVTRKDLGPEAKSTLERDMLMMKKQAEANRAKRQALLKAYSDSVSKVFQGIRVKLTNTR